MPKRHPGTESLLTWLTANPRLPEPGRRIAALCQSLSEQVVEAIPADGPELTAGLRKLLEAKDCFVRAALDGKPVALVKVRETDGGAALDVPKDVPRQLIDFGWLPPVDDSDVDSE